jgi:hypothetical protein
MIINCVGRCGRQSLETRLIQRSSRCDMPRICVNGGGQRLWAGGRVGDGRRWVGERRWEGMKKERPRNHSKPGSFYCSEIVLLRDHVVVLPCCSLQQHASSASGKRCTMHDSETKGD